MHIISDFQINDIDICLADSASTYTIIKDKKYFLCLKIKDYARSVSTISGSTILLWESPFLMPKRIKFEISDALYSPNLIEIY